MGFKIGIDNYGLYPLNLSPLDTLKWALKHEAEGVAFSGLDEESRSKCNKAYLKEMAVFAENSNLYLEWGGGQHIPRDLRTWNKKSISDANKRSVEEANILGVDIIRSCSGGLMRWNPESLSTTQLLDEMAEELSSQLPMLREGRVILAIETHFEFTTFELLRVFEMCGVNPGDCLGICLDTMNLLTMLEDPLAATERVLPWVVSTHIKDGAVRLTEEGMQTFTCPIGEGLINLQRIIDLLSGSSREINLSVEDHGGDFFLPIFDSKFLQEFPDLSALEMVDVLEHGNFPEQGLKEGKYQVLDRAEWPQVCEERLSRDIVSLKDLEHG